MEPGDLAIRNLTYHHFAEHARPPTSAEIAATVGTDPGAIRTIWQRLHDAHALVIDPATGELRMANPFSAVPTAFRVRVGERSWYANCAWDAFGICAALHADGRIDAACADCGHPVQCEVRDRRPDDTGLLFHCLVPAATWWDDIVFT